jgi:hypothetical protein
VHGVRFKDGAIELVAGIGGLEEDDWNDYYTTIAVPNADSDRSFGAYAADLPSMKLDTGLPKCGVR